MSALKRTFNRGNYTKGLSFTSPAKASIMAYIEPIAACVFGYFRGEKLTALMVLGIVLTVAAIVFLNIKIKADFQP